jgi:hypothetical protein
MFIAIFTSRRLAALGALLFLGVGLLLVGPSAGTVFAAGPIVDTGGFEGYSLGLLQNQFGWRWAPNNPAAGSTATVQNSIVESGSRAVTATRAGGVLDSDSRWGVPVTGFPTGRYVTIDWDMQFSQPTNQTALGPFFGVEAYDATGSILLLGSLGVDATTRDVLYQEAGTGNFVPTGEVAGVGEWHHFRLVLDFVNDGYIGYFNGIPVATSGFVDGAQGLDDFTDATITAISAGPDSVSMSLSASAIFDNFLIRDGLAGDYNGNGIVDGADYSIWRDRLGQTFQLPNEGANTTPGVVTQEDYTVWRQNFGTSLFTFESGSGSSSVPVLIPEPSSLLLVLCGLPLGWRVRDRRQRREV